MDPGIGAVLAALITAVASIAVALITTRRSLAPPSTSTVQFTASSSHIPHAPTNISPAAHENVPASIRLMRFLALIATVVLSSIAAVLTLFGLLLILGGISTDRNAVYAGLLIYLPPGLILGVIALWINNRRKRSLLTPGSVESVN